MSDAAPQDVDDLDIEYVRNLRLKITASLTKDGGTIPEAVEDREFLHKTLDGLVKTALAKKKLKVDAGIATSNAEVANVLSKLFNDARVQGLYKADTGGTIPTLPDEFKTPTVVPGELSDVGTDTIGHGEFIRRLERDEGIA